jgi:hypothetical protein
LGGESIGEGDESREENNQRKFEGSLNQKLVIAGKIKEIQESGQPGKGVITEKNQ